MIAVEPLTERAVTRKFISSGSTFERDISYSRAVIDGRWVFVSGTTGFDYGTMVIADDVVAQAEQCFKNIQRALADARWPTRAAGWPTWYAYATSCPSATISRSAGRCSVATLATSGRRRR